MKLLAYLLLAAVAVGQMTKIKPDCAPPTCSPVSDAPVAWTVEHTATSSKTVKTEAVICAPEFADLLHRLRSDKAQIIREAAEEAYASCKVHYELRTVTSPAPAKPEYMRDVTESQGHITIIGDPIPPMVVSAIQLEVGPDIPKCMKNGEQWFPGLPDGDMNQFIPACRHLGGKVTHYKAMEYSCSDKRRVMFTTEGGEKICVLFPQESK